MARLKSPVRSVSTRKCGMGAVLAASFNSAASLLAFPGLATKQFRTTNILPPQKRFPWCGGPLLRNNLSPSRRKMNGEDLAVADHGTHRDGCRPLCQSKIAIKLK